MSGIISQLAPVFIYFGIGLVLKKTAIADKSHGEFLLRFVFFVTLPLLILISLPRTTMTLDRAILPLINIGVNLGCMLATLGLAGYKQLDKQTTGTMLVNTMIVNNSYMFPFILAVYGNEGFTIAILFDFGNALMMATFVYALAFRYGGEQHGRWMMLRRILNSPLVWSLALAVLLSITGTALPGWIESMADPLAQMTGPLILVALGIYFSLDVDELSLVSLTVIIRMVLGLFIGTSIAFLAGLEGLAFIVVSLCSAAPIGFNALAITSLAKLDTRLSSSAVSISILAGLVYIPLLILLFGMPAV